MVEEIESTIGQIDVLVNNAGYGHEGILEESPLAEMHRQFDVNVFGAVAMIKAVLPGMRQPPRTHYQYHLNGQFHYLTGHQLLLWK